MRIVAIALVMVGVASPAFAQFTQFQQLRQFGAGPNPNTNGSDRYDRNDGTYVQPSQRTSPNDYSGDNNNALGNYTPNRGIYLTTPNFSR
jgi:hypothetical protein